MQVFARETTDYIADRFCEYYDKMRPKPISIIQAEKLIDYVSGPCPKPSGNTTVNLSSPHVTGGGKRRPSKNEIDAIVNADDGPTVWDELFDALIARSGESLRQLMQYAFDEQMPADEIAQRLGIVDREYYRRRLVILSQAAVMAAVAGLIEY